MAPIGLPEVIVIAVALILLVLPLGIAAALLWYFVLRRQPRQVVEPPKCTGSIQDRLSEIDRLRARNLISETEHAEKRRRILDEN
jgi:hypothetical protein